MNRYNMHISKKFELLTEEKTVQSRSNKKKCISKIERNVCEIEMT